MKIVPRIVGGATARLACLLLAGFLACAGCSDPTPEAQLKEAQQSFDRGERNKAMIQLKNLLKSHPDHAEARYLLGAVYNDLWDGRAAEGYLRWAAKLKLVKGGRVDAELGRALFLSRQYKKLLEDVKPLPSFEPDVAATVLALRGRAHLGLGQIKEAKALQEEAARTSATNAEAGLLAASMSMLAMDFPETQRAAEGVLAHHPKHLEAWVMKADALRGQAKRKEAFEAYETVLKLAPWFITARLARASLNMQVGRVTEAHKDVDLVLKQVKNYPMALYLKALLQFRTGKFRDAQTTNQLVRKALPDYAPAALLAGAIHYAVGEFEQAERLLNQYLAGNPRSVYARKLLASTLVEMRQGKRAMEVLEPVLARDLQDSVTLALAGQASLDSGEFDKARQFLAKAAAEDPKNPRLRTDLARSRIAGGDVDGGIADLEAASQLRPGAKTQADVLLFMTHLTAKRYDKAMEAALVLAKKEPKNPLPYNLMGIAQADQKDLAAARKSFERALGMDSAYFPAAAHLAQMDMSEKDFTGARKRLEPVLKKTPNDLQAMLLMSQIAGAQGATVESTGWLERAIKAQPTALEPRVRLVGLHLQSGERRKALDIAEEALRTNPQHPAAYELVGAAQLALGDKNSAIATLTKLVSVAPALPVAYQRLASAQVSAGRPADAEATLRRALEVNPDFVEAKSGLVALLIRSGRNEEAMRIAQQVKRAQPQSATGLELEGDVLAMERKYAPAVKAYEAAFAIAPVSKLAIKIYQTRVWNGEVAAAEAHLQRWIKAHPEDAAAQVNLAEAHIHAGKLKEGVEVYEMVVKRTPNHVAALNNLALAYLQQRDPRAVGLAERAHKLQPENADILDTYGWVLVENGKAETGRPLLEKAAALAPANPETRYHLAVALARSGNKAAARKELEKLIASGKKFSQMEEAKALLKQL